MPISVGLNSLLLKVVFVCMRLYGQQLWSSRLGQQAKTSAANNDLAR